MSDFNYDSYVKFNTDFDNNSLLFSFIGKMDTEISMKLSGFVVEKLKYSLSNGYDKTTTKVIFDLDSTTFVSSFFLRVCFVVLKEIAPGNFSIINASQQVNSILKMSGLEKVTKILNKEENVKVFYPPLNFSENANIKSFSEYKEIHSNSIENPVQFWGKMAKENIDWYEDFNEVLEWNLPNAKWFLDGKLNVCYNCVDKHLQTDIADKTAIIWEGEPTIDDKPIDKRYITYRQLHQEVSIFSNVLIELGVKKGDRVIIYMPMIPESIFAMLACARIGAIHSVVFAGFSPQSIADRIIDCQATYVITADESYRRGKIVPLKDNVDKAIEICNSINSNSKKINKVLMIKRTGNVINYNSDIDVIFDDIKIKVDSNSTPEIMDSEDTLFILYTSGSTGKPKGIYHASAGYLLSVNLSFKHVMDYKNDDIFWCSADIGWVTGHSYIVYGPLSNGATIYLYEGAPDFPNYDRFWKIIEANKISIFYTAPTAIRAFMKWGESWINKYDLSSLRLLGTVGEPINPEAWIWYYENIGKSNCPIIDTWWQTETGSIMISPLPGATPTKPGSAGVPFWGIDALVIDDEGKPVAKNVIGNLVIRQPWPSIARGIWGANDRFKQVYWTDFEGYYFTGDSARIDEDGFFWIVGRVDDVIVVSGHNIGAAEVESALVAHHSVAEAAVVGRPDDTKTTVIVAFVTLKSGINASDELIKDLKQNVGNMLGHLAKPEEIRFTEALPKTRSGKIMRRLLRQIAAGTDVTGDITTLEDFTVIGKLSKHD